MQNLHKTNQTATAHRPMRRFSILLLALFILTIFEGGASQTNWTHHPSNPALKLGDPGEWDEYWLSPESIVRTDTAYHMWYFGVDNKFNTGVGYAVSTDGINWEKYEYNPILTKGQSGSWNEASIGCGPALVINDKFHCWFWGQNSDMSIKGYGLATSTDGITWTEYENNPVIPDIPTGTWDDHWTLQSPWIIFDGEQYMMWYSGCRNEFKAQGFYTMRIGCATSPDGIKWTPFENNPILVESKNLSDWDYWKVEMPTVIKDQTGYHMWFHGDNGKSQIGYAHSSDGFNWTKNDENPVLSPKNIGSWSQIGIMGPKVIYDASDNTYKMWYMGGSILNGSQRSQIGYATAPNDSVETQVQNRNRHGISERFTLYQNYPNPFNPSTTIEFECYTPTRVTLEIYDLLGRKVKTIVNEERASGCYSETWHSKDEWGQLVPAGIYIARLTAGDFEQSIKLTLIR